MISSTLVIPTAIKFATIAAHAELPTAADRLTQIDPHNVPTVALANAASQIAVVCSASCSAGFNATVARRMIDTPNSIQATLVDCEAADSEQSVLG